MSAYQFGLRTSKPFYLVVVIVSHRVQTSSFQQRMGGGRVGITMDVWKGTMEGSIAESFNTRYRVVVVFVPFILGKSCNSFTVAPWVWWLKQDALTDDTLDSIS